ncbi:hypothetical protein ISS03_00330 [Patescibacteria group bacterium]|nr:hypothetical protein [Patescibacteria group bacterium]
MWKKRFLPLTLLLTILLCGCATSIGKPQKMSKEETAINACSIIVEKISLYQHQGTGQVTEFMSSIPKEGLDFLSVEEMRSTCDGPCPRIIPMSRAEFEQYVQKERHVFKGESIQFVSAKVGNESTMTATIRNIKYGLARKDGHITITNMYLTQTYMNGKPCGVWRTVPK